MRIGDQVDYTLLIFPSTDLKRLAQYFYRDILDISQVYIDNVLMVRSFARALAYEKILMPSLK